MFANVCFIQCFSTYRLLCKGVCFEILLSTYLSVFLLLKTNKNDTLYKIKIGQNVNKTTE